MLNLQGISKRFGERLAVNEVSLSVAQGEFFGLLGPNGAGKSTAISMIVGALAPDSGSITLDGMPVTLTANDAKANIGFVPQEIALYEDLSPYENLLFFGSLYPIPKSQLLQMIPVVLNQVSLIDRINEPVHKFSGGMKRRLNIAVAMLHSPKLLILDEPTVGVDPQSRNQIFETLEAINKGGTTIIYTSHYMEEVERLCHRIAIIDNGKVVTVGTKQEIAKLIPNLNILTVTVSEPPNQVTMNEILARFTKAEISEESVLKVPIGRVEEDVPWIIQNLAPFGISSLRTEESSLEDVFLHLTGKGLRD
jgi:ABC-2 type transport system ATP-binding protein